MSLLLRVLPAPLLLSLSLSAPASAALTSEQLILQQQRQAIEQLRLRVQIQENQNLINQLQGRLVANPFLNPNQPNLVQPSAYPNANQQLVSNPYPGQPGVPLVYPTPPGAIPRALDTVTQGSVRILERAAGQLINLGGLF
jgi:hypothetical protein